MEPIDIQETPPDEPETSRSADTIRQIPLHAAGHFHTPAEASMSPPDSPHLSPHSSPAHSAYPSPSSPSGESVSSLPSVSSSFLFSSGIGSSPHLGLGIHHDAHDHGLGDSSLIIPSLTLPSAVRRPTPYGQTLGDVRLLIWGAAGSGAEEVAQVIADEECEDIVEVGQWTDLEPESDHSGRAKVLRLSTDWIEHRDAHGLEKHEPSRNVEVVLLKDYGPDSNPDELLHSTLTLVHAPFNSLASVLHPEKSPDALLANLLASHNSPLYTVMIVVPSHSILPFEQHLIAELSTHIPLIVLPSHSSSPSRPIPSRSTTYHQSPYSRRQSLQGLHGAERSDVLRFAKLSSIRPHSAHALRHALLRSPEALATLRLEASERFMRWREVERAVGHVLRGTSPSSPPSEREPDRTPVVPRDEPQQLRRRSAGHTQHRWDKARWEAEWEGALATDVAKTLRARRAKGKGMERRSTVTSRPKLGRPRLSPMCTDVGVDAREHAGTAGEEGASGAPHFDPLHIPSLLKFSISLLGPLKSRIARLFTPSPSDEAVLRGAADVDAPGDGARYFRTAGMKWALIGVFCAGIGVGVVLSRSL